jgi:hypothetical protein
MPMPAPHDAVAMTLSTFRHTSLDQTDGRRGEEDAQQEPMVAEWTKTEREEAGVEDVRDAAHTTAGTATTSSYDAEGSFSRGWSGMPVEEVMVDDLLFLVCERDHRADFLRDMAEPTFLYAPKKGIAHYARRPKRQSIRSPSYVCLLSCEVSFVLFSHHTHSHTNTHTHKRKHRGASCSNCSKPKSTSWREGWIPRVTTPSPHVAHARVQVYPYMLLLCDLP